MQDNKVLFFRVLFFWFLTRINGFNNGISPRRHGNTEMKKRRFCQIRAERGVTLEFDKTGCIMEKDKRFYHRLFSGLQISTVSKQTHRSSGASVCESRCRAVYSASSVSPWLICRRIRSDTELQWYAHPHNQL